MNFRKPIGSQPQRQSGRNPSSSLQPGLYVVATPIGNARDITLRALDVLAAVDAVLAEDTRVSGKLLLMHGLKRPLVALHDHNEAQMADQIASRIRGGEAFALVSDAGTPLISDPGFKLIRALIAEGLMVTPIPGPSSALSALVVSGLPPDKFFFNGFPPLKQSARRAAFVALRAVPGSLIFFEAPSRVAQTLLDLSEVLGDRQAVVARELTKMFETCSRGTLGDLASQFSAQDPPKGEIVIVVGPPSEDSAPSADDLDIALRSALADAPLARAANEVADLLGLPRRAVYERALVLTGKKGEGA